MVVGNNVIQLWGAGTPRTLRPIWAAEELGLKYDLSPIGPRTGETQTDEYTRLNPKQKVPFLIDGELRLSESIAISRYLIDRYGGDKLWRAATFAERAREDEWCSFVFGEIDETSLYVMRRHGDLAHVYGAAPEVLGATADYLQRQFFVVAEHLKDQSFVMREGFGLVDILLTSCLDWAASCGLDLPVTLVQYRHDIAERPAFERAMNVNYSTKVMAHGTA